MVSLREKYQSEVKPALMAKRGFKNALQVPRVTKVVVNMGIGGAADKDTFKKLTVELAAITGQQPLVTKARKSISNFKLREGTPIGAMVTLRGRRMFEFLERLIHAALPRIRDFRGVSPRGFDGRGSYTFGIQEQTIFPEIDPDSVKKVQGMNITIVTTAHTDDEARDLLKLLGLPFAA